MILSCVLYAVLYLSSVISDLIPLYQNKRTAFWGILIWMIASSSVLTLFIILGVKIPSPAHFLEQAVSAVTGR